MIPYGFRIVGGCHQERRLVDHADAFRAYCDCDERASVDGEAYLSEFTFGEDFRALVESTRSVKGFNGPCGSAWLWFDIDRADDLNAALGDARKLAASLVARYQLDDDALLLFFSGSKGFHVGLPTALWSAEPSATFNRVCRRMAEGLAEGVGVKIDHGVYDKVRAFRAPNSLHPTTKLHKRRLTYDELIGLTIDGVRGLAHTSAPFDLPDPPQANDTAKEDWRKASEGVIARTVDPRLRTTSGVTVGKLNRATKEFILYGAEKGERETRLFEAAANLAEMSAPYELAVELLTEPGFDSGLKPFIVERQIECGWKYGIASLNAGGKKEAE